MVTLARRVLGVGHAVKDDDGQPLASSGLLSQRHAQRAHMLEATVVRLTVKMEISRT